MAECSTVVTGWRSVEGACRALGINKAVLRGEVDREAVGAHVNIAVGAVPPKGSRRNKSCAVSSITVVVGFMEAEEPHAALTLALRRVVIGRDGV